MPLPQKTVRQIAGFELNALNFSRILPDTLEGARIKAASTPIYDINGTLLFQRFSLNRGKAAVGYADVAAINPGIIYCSIPWTIYIVAINIYCNDRIKRQCSK